MKQYYDASKEFTPFANRGKGGALLEEPAYKGHPNKKNYRKATGKPNPSQHRPNRRIRVSERGDIRNGYTWVKV